MWSDIATEVLGPLWNKAILYLLYPSKPLIFSSNKCKPPFPSTGLCACLTEVIWQPLVVNAYR